VPGFWVSIAKPRPASAEFIHQPVCGIASEGRVEAPLIGYLTIVVISPPVKSPFGQLSHAVVSFWNISGRVPTIGVGAVGK
jgi:hypothetical protein